MLEELVQRIKLIDRAALNKAVTAQLRAAKEDLAAIRVDEEVDRFVAEMGRSGFFASTKARLATLRKAIDELDGGGRANDRERDELPPLDHADLRVRARHHPRIIVGLPVIDRALLDDRGDKSYVWIQDGGITAIGPERAAIEELFRPYKVVRPAWQTTWRELTGDDANPWRPPTEAELVTLFAAALERTFGPRPVDPYGQRHPQQAIRHAVDEWARVDARALVERLTAAATGEARPIDASHAASLLSELTRRHGALPGAALVPLLVGEVAREPAVEIWPTPAGLRFDLIGRTSSGHLRLRAITLRGHAAAWHRISADGAPRTVHLFEGGNLVLALGDP